jgi:hypothetical protein
MAVTISAIVFLVGILALTAIGIRLLQKKSKEATLEHRDKCTLCRNVFDKEELVLREVGDYKLLYFCRSCILKLYSDIGLKN